MLGIQKGTLNLENDPYVKKVARFRPDAATVSQSNAMTAYEKYRRNFDLTYRV